MNTEPVLVIVGHDRDVAATAADLARSRGFATHVAHSVAESARFSCVPRDLSLLDLDLPDGSGFDVLEKCRLDDYGKIVFVTGERRAQPHARAASRPASDYLTKPLSLDRLDRLLSEVSLRVSHRGAAANDSNLGLLGESRAIRRLRHEIVKVAGTDVPAPAYVLPFAVAADLCLSATRAFGRMRTTVVVDRLLRSGLQPAGLL